MKENLLKRKQLLLLGVLTLWVGALFAQERTVTGEITDRSTGDPLPGATVLIKGTTTGTTSNLDGLYSIQINDGDVLIYTFSGYGSQEITPGARSVIDVTLEEDVTKLSEVVVVGYGTQEKKEITGAVLTIDESSFNKGNINDPTQLLQGKVPGLSVYNKGGDPNSTSVIRLRGVSTVGQNTEPLIVIDGVIGASLDNVDPNDIESMSVLKDGSAAAIYGSRGSSGVILVTTKSGKRGTSKLKATYNGFVSAATLARNQPVMTRDEYVEAGGNDIGSITDWQDEVTRTGISNVHNFAVSGGTEKTNFRFSTNFRDIDGILNKSGFDQINARAFINHYAINDRLNLTFNMSFTNRESNFSFNEALRYATLFNPTAPVLTESGDYYQAILFDNFNPVAIIEQNQNVGKRKNLNFNTRLSFEIIDGLTVTANYAQQYNNNVNGEYYPRTSLFRGYNRGGLAKRFISDDRFTLFEAYGSYDAEFGNSLALTFTAGYSFQEEEYEDITIEAGNFPSDSLGFNILESSGNIVEPGLIAPSSSITPKQRIIAFFGRLNLTILEGIYFNASVRREGSTKLGTENQWGIFPAVGLGVNINQFADLGTFNNLKFRIGYGITGALPRDAGLSQDLYEYSRDGGGTVSFTRAGNDSLKWEEKSELNLGIDFGVWNNKLSGSLDIYNRDINDFILERTVESALYGTDRRIENGGKLNTRGIELSLNYNGIGSGDFSWSPGIVLSSYQTKLMEFDVQQQTRPKSNLGAPGQNGTNVIRAAVGEEIGQIWGPVFEGVDSEGAPIFADLNDDGTVTVDQGSALDTTGDFQQLGNGLPDIELGWTNQIQFRNWDFNAFFRAALGHSLVNTFRAFYEPIDPGAINSYNRIKTDLQEPDLQVAQFSSLYVERADFFRLDNVTLGYNFDVNNSKAFSNIRLYFNVQNVFTITNYQGLDPEPVLQDNGAIDNGDVLDLNTPDVLSPGIDRRNNYFTARTFTFGINLGF